MALLKILSPLNILYFSHFKIVQARMKRVFVAVHETMRWG